ncbi:hypothetical protein GPECTOR_5g64 [Gonium pectorale]|uniref:Amidase domain-containing protein n=1 Tax=Gonium pectorale TaxID=33097 RepID=A0A150GX67_GONPE|nr:hypothetical protein GPECTOR_5g64 [Gonium pectorale]|eukprot:KXZ54409.1 hypothetical protein GPECTOR_5g64 [Gonium pectorale]
MPAASAQAEPAPLAEPSRESSGEPSLSQPEAEQPEADKEREQDVEPEAGPPAAEEPLEPAAPPDELAAALDRPSSIERSQRNGPLVPAIIAASIVVGVWLFRRLRGSRGSPTARRAARGAGGAAKADAAAPATAAPEAEAEPLPPPEPIEPDTFEVMVCGPPAELAAVAAAAGSGSLPAPLAGVTLVVSEDVDVAGTSTTLGVDGGVMAEAAAASAGAVGKLAAAGASCVGKAGVQPLGLDTLGANFGNPYNKAMVSGGGQTGSAVAVATGLAQLALVSDVLGSGLLPAACCGLYGYRASPGALGHVNAAGAASPEGLQSAALMAADPGVLLRAAQALGVPGNFNLRGEIVRFVVAEDLFSCCAVEYRPAALAVKRAILKWAGSEQAGGVQLCKFLAEQTGGWQAVQLDAQLADIGGLPPGLAAWATAARTLRAENLRAALPAAAAEASAAAAKAAAAAAKVEPAAAQPAEADAAEPAETPVEATEAATDAAEGAEAEAKAGVAGSEADGLMAEPAPDAEPAAADGHDEAVDAAAEADAVAEPAAAAAAADSDAVADGAADGAAADDAAVPPTVDPRRLERAEKFKARGNDQFKAGRYAEAMAEYSRAISEHPENPVYYNNRAMASLKLFRFEAAEEDCNRALQLDLKGADKAKALLRRATARTALQKYPEAEKDLRQVLSIEPNNRQAREDLQHLQQMKADMAAAQQRMVAEFQAQRRLAAGGSGGGAAPGGGGSGGGAMPPGLPPGFDPSALPPGFDWSQLAAAGPEALAHMMGAGGGMEGGAPAGLGGFGSMFSGGR